MVQSFYRRLRMPPAPLTTPANQFANPGGFARTSAFRPSTLLPVDQAGNKQMSLLQKGMDMAKGPQGQSLLGALATPFATSALAGALGNTMNPNLRGLAGALKGVADRDAAEATIAGRAGKQTSAIDNFNFLQKLIEKGAPQKEIDTFRNLIKRGSKVVDDGTHIIFYDSRTGQEIYRIRKDATYPTEEAGMVKTEEKEAERVAEIKKNKPKMLKAIKQYLREVALIADTMNEAINILVDSDKKGFFSKAAGLATYWNFFPLSASNRLASLFDTIFASNAFGRLQQMREASVTGGALGNVSNVELNLLKTSRAALSQKNDPKIIIRTLKQLFRNYEDQRIEIIQAYKEDTGEDLPAEFNVKIPPLTGKTPTGDNAANASEETSEWKKLSEENKQAIIKVFKDNPSDENKQAIIELYGMSVFNKFFGDQ